MTSALPSTSNQRGPPPDPVRANAGTGAECEGVTTDGGAEGDGELTVTVWETGAEVSSREVSSREASASPTGSR